MFGILAPGPPLVSNPLPVRTNGFKVEGGDL